MKKKTIAISVIISLLLIGIVSANLLIYFGRITGSVEVGNPVFYLDGTKDSQYEKYYTLKLNDDGISAINFLLSGDENVWFISETLGIDDFYDEQYEIKLRMKTIHEDDSLTGSIYAKLWTGDEDNYWQEEICNTILIGIEQEEKIYTFNCIPNNDGGLKNIDSNEKLMLSLTTTPTNIDIRIYTLNSKVEIVPK